MLKLKPGIDLSSEHPKMATIPKMVQKQRDIVLIHRLLNVAELFKTAGTSTESVTIL